LERGSPERVRKRVLTWRERRDAHSVFLEGKGVRERVCAKRGRKGRAGFLSMVRRRVAEKEIFFEWKGMKKEEKGGGIPNHYSLRKKKKREKNREQNNKTTTWEEGKEISLSEGGKKRKKSREEKKVPFPLTKKEREDRKIPPWERDGPKRKAPFLLNCKKRILRPLRRPPKGKPAKEPPQNRRRRASFLEEGKWTGSNPEKKGLPSQEGGETAQRAKKKGVRLQKPVFRNEKGNPPRNFQNTPEGKKRAIEPPPHKIRGPGTTPADSLHDNKENIRNVKAP